MRNGDLGMNDRLVGMWFVSAAALWALTFALVLGGGLVGVVSNGMGEGVGFALVGLGLATSAAAATVSIKHMLCRYHGLLQDAFEMGREVGRERAVRSLR